MLAIQWHVSLKLRRGRAGDSCRRVRENVALRKSFVCGGPDLPQLPQGALGLARLNERS